MKISVISDTHNEHEKLGRLSGEVLVHCGDLFNLFGHVDDELERIDEWFGQQDFDLILCTETALLRPCTRQFGCAGEGSPDLRQCIVGEQPVRPGTRSV